MIAHSFIPAILEHSPTLNTLGSRMHGLDHWHAVAKNGAQLAARTKGADPEVVALFAWFHDTWRWNDERDPNHGRRAVSFAVQLGVPEALTPWQWTTLRIAMEHHNGRMVHRDPTIGCCWDADRLDLPRVNVRPVQDLMSTRSGKARVRRDFAPRVRYTTRDWESTWSDHRRRVA